VSADDAFAGIDGQDEAVALLRAWILHDLD